MPSAPPGPSPWPPGQPHSALPLGRPSRPRPGRWPAADGPVPTGSRGRRWGRRRRAGTGLRRRRVRPAAWPAGGGRPRRRGRSVAGRVAAWRVAAGSGAVVVAVVAGLLASWRAPPAGGGGAGTGPAVAVLVLARDLPAGAVPARDDLRTVLLPPTAVPADAIATPPEPEMGLLALAVRRGDVLSGRQFGAGWSRTGSLRAYTLAVGDGVEAGPLAPGDRVDVLAACVPRRAPWSRTHPSCGSSPGQTATLPRSSWASPAPKPSPWPPPGSPAPSPSSRPLLPPLADPDPLPPDDLSPAT
jgi:hypothetical protein